MKVTKVIFCMLIILFFGCIQSSSFAQQSQTAPAPPFGAIQTSEPLADGDWLMTYGGEDYEEASDAQETADGGFILIGTDNKDVDEKTLLIKTAADGSEEWTRLYANENTTESGRSVEQTPDGGYIMASLLRTEGGAEDILLRKTDPNGIVEWEKTFDNGTDEGPRRIRITSDGGYIILGYSLGDLVMGEIYLVKADGDGNLQWSTTYSNTEWDDGKEIIETADSGFVVLIISVWIGEQGLVKFDMDGNFLWYRSLGNPYDSLDSMDQTSDGGFVIVGGQASLITGSNTILLKTDSEGVEQWLKTYGSEFSAYFGIKVRRSNDNGFIILNWTDDSLDWDSVLLKTDADGNEVWRKEIAEEYSGKEPESLEMTSDGGFVVGGSVNEDAMLIKAFTPELSAIALLSPPDGSFQVSPPTFQWSPNGGKEVAYAVDFSLSSSGPVYSTYEDLHMIITEPRWTLPQNLWNKVPPGKWVLWQVRGLDLGATPRQVVTSEPRFFYRW